MGAQRDIHRWVTTLSGSDRASLKAAERGLARAPTQGSSEEIFTAIGRFVPAAGGLIGTLGAESVASPVSHVINLPPAVIEGWASTPGEHLKRMLAPMVGARLGDLISDSEAIVGPFREQLDLLRDLRDAGLGESAGYKVSTRRRASGGVEHHFMTFALPRGEMFKERDRLALAFLQPTIRAALDRLKVPLIASQSILSQVVDERSMGFMCLSLRGRIIEVNQRMHSLVMRYLNATRTIGGRGALSRFAERVLLETSGGKAWPLWHEDGHAMAEITCHRLAKEAHIIGEDLFLVIMKEISLTPPAPLSAPLSAPIGMLTGRQKEIARLLIGSGLSYKEIADKLGISVATMGKHAENIYRAAGVHSRAELGMKLR